MNRGWTSEETVEMGKRAIKGMTSGLEKSMNPPEDGFDGQADIRTNAQGQKWVYCPWCDKKHFPLNQEAVIKDFHYQCRNSKCKRIFIVNTEW
ncbi:hypothetical protein [Lacrimispora sp.]|uniref:hypothetical protein n=1 Tax=Lacrimispora sp. TaxID=2719234 RepID=UPI00289A2E3B|nr:hypothetical protein [Lacrimispora sp.]